MTSFDLSINLPGLDRACRKRLVIRSAWPDRGELAPYARGLADSAL